MSPEMSLRCSRVEEELQKMRVAFFHERHSGMESSTFSGFAEDSSKKSKNPKSTNCYREYIYIYMDIYGTPKKKSTFGR